MSLLRRRLVLSAVAVLLLAGVEALPQTTAQPKPGERFVPRLEAGLPAASARPSVVEHWRPLFLYGRWTNR